MDKFIARLNIEHCRLNIEHYCQVLAAECDPERRQVVLRQLAEEESKLAALERASSPATAAPPATANQGVSHLNVEYYRKRLASESDPVIQGILNRLIAEEEARIAPPKARKASGGV